MSLKTNFRYILYIYIRIHLLYCWVMYLNVPWSKLHQCPEGRPLSFCFFNCSNFQKINTFKIPGGWGSALDRIYIVNVRSSLSKHFSKQYSANRYLLCIALVACSNLTFHLHVSCVCLQTKILIIDVISFKLISNICRELWEDASLTKLESWAQIPDCIV